MSFIKNKLNKVFCKPRTISPGLSQPCTDFCCRAIHAPQFECCLTAAAIKRPTNGQTKRRSYRFKRRGKSRSPKIQTDRCTTRPLDPHRNNRLQPCSRFDLLLNANRLLNKSICSSENILCDKFDQIGLSDMTPRLNKIYTRIPEHDKKILNRMAMKRKEEIARLDDAFVAQRYWDKERSNRDHMMTAHNEQLMNAIKKKRMQDTIETEIRLRDIAAREETYLERIRGEIAMKNQKLMHRLKKTKLNDEILKCERRERELRKYEGAIVQQLETQLNEDMRKQQCSLQLENRISRADAIRNHCLAAYKRRLLADNRVQQHQHAINYEETKRVEQFKLQQLKHRIRERDQKTDQFIDRRQKHLDESREQARATAELRDIIRRSISPENHSYRGFYNSMPRPHERPMSNLSFQSHLKLG